MKFSEFDAIGWPGLQPYFDTCLLPVTGLTGTESPPEATEKAARTGDWLSPLEAAFRGRTVTLPAYHYYDGADPDDAARLARHCGRLKQAGFRFVVLVSGTPGLLPSPPASADLLVQPSAPDEQPDAEEICRAVAAMWKDA
ncbi:MULTISPECIES: DUF2487 family protein [Cohnella]|jgi:hypothetical protein|uniref:DUF2487 family protein n=1 Tax=Cohnella TaxID=329857 RepID=UPI000E366768|nr:DUF2487 family protein [Cohnella sp.]REK66153.1 MAG: DUF2487 domain-containing protein [Cohnella sp.]